MKTRSPKKPVKATNYFVCDSPGCSRDGMTPLEAKDHLKTVHKIESGKGSKKMTLHLDCEDSYHSTWEWRFGDVIMQQYCANPRTEETRFIGGD